MSVFVVLGCAIAMSIVHIAWYEWVALARRRHAIVCRDAYLINVGANVAATLVYLAVCWWALGPEWLGVAVAAPTLLVLDWTMFRLNGHGNQPLGVYSSWRLYRPHRDHDDDCEHGPKRERGRASRPLRSWRKVAIRPGFAST